ncbi:hypothetical protein Xmir_03041 [Xenorhabdus miraniensis]|uniref:Uncharacterized protein n=1 Tax=Xenorhabdus miraniensis TaxID=351674 RepID=A0A2D0JN22_9GAMM|nr:hypothetical protein Xmir_03041 [Xenorhabdus miraniensis]
MTQGRQTHSLLSGLIAQTVIQLRRQQSVRFRFLSSIMIDLRQPERQRGLLHFRQHLGKETGIGFLTHPQPNLCHQIAEWYRHRQALFLSRQAGQHFTVHHFQRFMVTNQVML